MILKNIQVKEFQKLVDARNSDRSGAPVKIDTKPPVPSENSTDSKANTRQLAEKFKSFMHKSSSQGSRIQKSLDEDYPDTILNQKNGQIELSSSGRERSISNIVAKRLAFNQDLLDAVSSGSRRTIEAPTLKRSVSRPTSIKLSQVSSSRSPPPTIETPKKALIDAMPPISPPPPSPRSKAFQELFDTPDSLKRRYIKCNHKNFQKRYPRYSRPDIGELIYSAVNRRPYQKQAEEQKVSSFRSYKEFQHYSSQSIDLVLERTLTNIENSQSHQDIPQSAAPLEGVSSVVSQGGGSAAPKKAVRHVRVTELNLDYVPILGELDAANSPKFRSVRKMREEAVGASGDGHEEFRSEDTSVVSVFPDLSNSQTRRKAGQQLDNSISSTRGKGTSLDAQSMPRLLSKLKSVKKHLGKDLTGDQTTKLQVKMKDVEVSGASAIYIPKKQIHIKKSHTRQSSILQDAFHEANSSQFLSIATPEPKSALLPSVIRLKPQRVQRTPIWTQNTPGTLPK